MAKSKSTKSKKMSVGTLASKQVSAILALVQKAATAVAETPRMTVVERKRTAKMKRGAHQVIPLIAVLAQKFGVEAPGSPVVEMSSNMEHAQSLEPLLATLASLYGTVRDEHLRSQADAWSTAVVTYGMLKKAGEANQHIRDELAPVTKWFRHVRAAKAAKSANGAAAPPQNPQPEQPAGATPIAPSGTPNGAESGAEPKAVNA